jgi:hypothetical protein
MYVEVQSVLVDVLKKQKWLVDSGSNVVNPISYTIPKPSLLWMVYPQSS